MGFFGRDNEEKRAEEAKKQAESQRLTAKLAAQPVVKAPQPKVALKSFVLGLATSEKLSAIPNEKFEEGLRNALPRGTRVSKVDPGSLDLAPRRAGVRYFEIGLEPQNMAEAINALVEKGILEGQVNVSLDQVAVTCGAVGKAATIHMSGEPQE